jgi:hypothetical protein
VLKRIKELFADDQFGSTELRSKLDEQLREKFKCDNSTKESTCTFPWVVELYPFENYFIYSYEGSLFRQNYVPNLKKRTVTFKGTAEEVIQKYVNVGASRMETVMKTYATGTGPAGPSGNSGLAVGDKMTPTIQSDVDPAKTMPGTGNGPRIKKAPPSNSNMGKVLSEQGRVKKIVTKNKKK